MAALTPFGKELRKLRIEKEMRLYDLAQALGKSSALVSAIETGRKPIPDGFVVTVSRAMQLTAVEIRALRSAKDKTVQEVRVAHLSPERRELVAALARGLDDFSPEQLERLRKELLESDESEQPFKRRRGMTVPPASYAKLERLALKVRSVFSVNSTDPIKIIEIIELKLPKLIPEFSFEIRERAEMGSAEGVVLNGQNRLILRADVYEGACLGEGRARFTACHELGHYILHHEIGMARARQDQDPIYCDAEWQADSFAGFLLMPRTNSTKFTSLEEAATMCGMSVPAAKIQLSRYACK